MIPKRDPEALAKLLKTPKAFLSPIEQQQQYVANLHATPCTCPMCCAPCSVFEAGDGTLVLGETYEGKYVCPNCDTELVKVVPFVMQPGTPGWQWERAHPIPGKKGGGS